MARPRPPSGTQPPPRPPLRTQAPGPQGEPPLQRGTRSPTMPVRAAGPRTLPVRSQAGTTIPPRTTTRSPTPPPRPAGATIPPRSAGATIPPRSSGSTLTPRSATPPPRPAAGTTIPPRPPGATIPPRGSTLPTRTLSPRNLTPPQGTPREPGPRTTGVRPLTTRGVGQTGSFSNAGAPPNGANGGANGASGPNGASGGGGGAADGWAAARQPEGGGGGDGTEGGGSSGRRWGRGRALWAAVVLLALVVVGVGGYYGYLSYAYYSAGPAQGPVRVEVAPGATLKLVLNDLNSKGALADESGTLMYLRLTGENTRIKVGTYEFPARSSPAKMIGMLRDGKVVLEQLTVIEGSTFADFRRSLDESPVVTHALRGKSDAQVMAALGHPQESPEGRFFPDTYLFGAQTSDLEILQMAYNKMQHLIDKEWPGHDTSLPYSTPYQALTMASLVEKETGVPAERPRIAGVFINRLRKGMRLQTDPAVIYGLGPAYDGSIHKKDLETDNAYNTYTRGGLPPTPIALPGREAVIAAMHPESTDALYFVATGNGGHHFSSTLEEHNAAVRSYLSSRRAQGGSAGGQ